MIASYFPTLGEQIPHQGERRLAHQDGDFRNGQCVSSRGRRV
jgi:hypothetical protein